MGPAPGTPPKPDRVVVDLGRLPAWARVALALAVVFVVCGLALSHAGPVTPARLIVGGVVALVTLAGLALALSRR